MILNTKQIAITIAVVIFFILSAIGSFSGLSPFACGKRAIAGAAVAYIMAAVAVKAINAILLNAIIESQINPQKEKPSDSKD